MDKIKNRAHRVQIMRECGEWPEANETWREFSARKRREEGADGNVAAWLIAIFSGAVISAMLFIS